MKHKNLPARKKSLARVQKQFRVWRSSRQRGTVIPQRLWQAAAELSEQHSVSKISETLAGVCRNVLEMDPFSGYVFVFRNRRKTAIKILMYDGQGFWLCQKRLSKGRFNWWPANGNTSLRPLAVHELQLLIWNGNPRKAHVAPLWKPIQEKNEKL